MDWLDIGSAGIRCGPDGPRGGSDLDWLEPKWGRLGSDFDSIGSDVDPTWIVLDRYGSVATRSGIVWVRHGSDLDWVVSIWGSVGSDLDSIGSDMDPTWIGVDRYGSGRVPIWSRLGPMWVRYGLDRIGMVQL